MKKILFLILIFNWTTVFADAQSDYEKLSAEYHKFFLKKQNRDKWIELIKKFERHAKKYKKQNIAAKSFYNAATLYYKIYRISHRRSDINKSMDNYKKVCLSYPESNLADDSCRFLYEYYFKKEKNYEKAKKYSVYILKHYKKSDNYKKALEFVKKYFPKVLLRKSSSPLKTKENKFVKVSYYKDRVVLGIKSRHNETAKIGEVKVEGKLVKVFIDLKNESVLRVKPLKVGFIIERIRFGQYKKDTARIVADLEENTVYKILDRGKTLVLSFGKNNEFQKDEIVPKEIIKTENKNEDDKAVEHKENVKKQVDKHSDKEKVNAKATNGEKENKKNKKYTIIIDAGHGGKDPGAQSKDKKIKEKDLTLKVALKLAGKLRKNPKYKVILTRKTDKFLTLDQRTDIANDNKGDIFISLHINAIPNKKFYGIETFYLNIAADNYSRRLESVENAENQKKITDLQFILADLLKKANTKESVNLAKYVQSSIVYNLRRKYKKIRNLGVKNAMFYVLLDTKMPSILVELGFITNPFELKRLKNSKYQDMLAESIYKGINKYFKKHKKKK